MTDESLSYMMKPKYKEVATNNTIDSNYDRFEKYLTIQKIYTGGQYRDMTFNFVIDK